MNNKYTVRDFLVYFITGLFLLLTLLYQFRGNLLTFFGITKEEIEKHPTLTVFILVPGLYLLGHTIHGIDLLMFKVSRMFADAKKKHTATEENTRKKKLVNFFYLLLAGNRITGMLDKKKIKHSTFWQQSSVLLYQEKFNVAEYWMIMNDLFKGLTLISFGWVCFYTIKTDWVNLLIAGILCVTFWLRARHFAINFVSTAVNLYKAYNQVNNQV